MVYFHQHLRFRLQPDDLTELRRARLLISTTYVGSTRFRWIILLGAGARQTSLSYRSNRLQLTLPRRAFVAWATNADAPPWRERIKKGKHLDVLVLLEKDPDGAHDLPPGEDAANLYPHRPDTGEAAPSD